MRQETEDVTWRGEQGLAGYFEGRLPSANSDCWAPGTGLGKSPPSSWVPGTGPGACTPSSCMNMAPQALDAAAPGCRCLRACRHCGRSARAPGPPLSGPWAPAGGQGVAAAKGCRGVGACGCVKEALHGRTEREAASDKHASSVRCGNSGHSLPVSTKMLNRCPPQPAAAQAGPAVLSQGAHAMQLQLSITPWGT